jgi:molybdopterin/thiamine biosynthesis adenylyltransferase/rhodanese-related sulfurtransferase
MATYRDLLRAVKSRIRETDVRQLDASRNGAQRPVLIDVREQDEVEQGVIPGAIHIPRGNLESRVEQYVSDRDAPIVTYCAAGNRSAFAAETLQQMGYSNVASLKGGFGAWKDAGLKFIVPRELSPSQQKRYSRHVLIPEVGKEGQLKLLDSKVLIIGAGGLGSPAAYYLAAAGVGTIGVVDSDVVDESNLQRQILHNSKRIGVPKVDSAKQTLEDLNPDVKVLTYQTRLTRDNIIDIFKDYDLIVDGSDNFPTRYLVNDASVLLKKTVVHGSIFRFDGQVSVFKPFDGPCYRCVFPEPPPAELAPSCDEAGTLGILPGIVGLFEANEAVKLLLSIGEPLIGRLLMIDALTDEFRTLRLKRDPNCPVCGDGAHFKDFVDYEVSTAIPTSA